MSVMPTINKASNFVELSNLKDSILHIAVHKQEKLYVD